MIDATIERRQRYPGRRRGERHDTSVTVRLPKELDRSARLAAKLCGVSRAAFVRQGIEARLATLAEAAVEFVNDPKTTGNHVLRMVEFLRSLRKAAMALEASPQAVQKFRAALRAARIPQGYLRTRFDRPDKKFIARVERIDSSST